MEITRLFLEELEKEAKSTRRVLEQVPEGKNDWKPHPRSMPLGYLAGLVAHMPAWIDFMVNQDSLDVNPQGGEPLRSPIMQSRAELLAFYDRNVARAREVLESTNEEHLLTPWKFLVSGYVADQAPRYSMIRHAVFNHWAHHRGQLTVYLRLNEAKVPAVYGPSADDRGGV